MFVNLSGWELAGLLLKLCWLLGVIAAVGGTFSVWLLADHSRRGLRWSIGYTLAGSLVGFHAVIGYFLVQIGAANANGLAGMLDWSMIRFYLELSIGETSLLRMGLFLVLVLGQLFTLAYLGRLSKPPGQVFFRFFYRLNAVALLVLLLSFQATGHLAPLGLAARFALVIHVLCAALWLGSLLPLWRSTRSYERETVQQVMRHFSRRATFLVGFLLAAALFLSISLLGGPMELVNSAYGLTLLLKAALAGVLLTLAAMNRWRLVPALEGGGSVEPLRRSIALEIVVGLAVLTVTVVLSTVIGPGSHAP